MWSTTARPLPFSRALVVLWSVSLWLYGCLASCIAASEPFFYKNHSITLLYRTSPNGPNVLTSGNAYVLHYVTTNPEYSTYAQS